MEDGGRGGEDIQRVPDIAPHRTKHPGLAQQGAGGGVGGAGGEEEGKKERKRANLFHSLIGSREGHDHQPYQRVSHGQRGDQVVGG